VTEAFFTPIGDHRFQPSDWCRGPWTPDAMHGSPPAALLGRAIEQTSPRHDALVVRASFELLGPVPIQPLTLTTEVVRPGRNVEMIDASLRTDEREVMRARAWRIRTTTLDLAGPELTPFAVSPSESPELPVDVAWEGQNYISAMEWRFASGTFAEQGPATCWFRMRIPLIADEEPSPLQRVLCAADSGSGISNELDFRTWVYVNPDLTVLLHRYPEGEWVCLDATTVAEGHGTGLCMTKIYDEKGPIGSSAQTLFIAPR
jgi:hypothetical protein